MLELFFIRFMMESTSLGVHGRKKKELRGFWVTEALEEVQGKEFEMVLPIVENVGLGCYISGLCQRFADC